MGCLIATGVLLTAALSASAQTPQIREKTRLEEVEQRIFDRVNEERMREGLNPVLAEAILVEIAEDHTMDMLEREYFSHDSPEGVGPVERVGWRHRTLVGDVSENIWQGTRARDAEASRLAREIMDGLMNSPGHRRNIMAPQLTHMGLGVYSSNGVAVRTNEIMVTQLFSAIRGYLKEPLQEIFLRNQTVRFRVDDLTGEQANARYYDLWSVEEQRPVIRPTSILQSKMEVPAGTYQLRFLYTSPQEGRLDAISAPYVTIR